jgi:hypothetical protein
MNDQKDDFKQVKDTFLKSRAASILRCAEIMAVSGRKDMAKHILVTTHIDRQRLEELKTQST